MKYFLISLIIPLMPMAFSQSFEINGSIIDSTGRTNYILYDVDIHGTWQPTDTTIINDAYDISLVPGTYLIVFRNRDKAKHLYLDLDSEQSGTYTMNVNFSLDTHAVIYYNNDFQKYFSYLVDNETIVSMYND